MMDAVRLAAAAECDPRTARRFLRGEPPHGESLAARLHQAAEALGMRVARAKTA